MKFIPAVFTGHKIDKPSLQHDFLILILVVKDIIIFLIAVGAFIWYIFQDWSFLHLLLFYFLEVGVAFVADPGSLGNLLHF